MQTFLTHPGFVRSVRALDDRRLGKQRVETFQILRALVWPSYGWKRHPAVTMWRGFTPALVCYGVASCREWSARGHSEALEPQLLEYNAGGAPTFDELDAEGRLPPWLGDPDVHRSHRRALAAKAPESYPAEWADGSDEKPAYVWPAPVYPLWPMPFPNSLRAMSPTRAVSALLDSGVAGAASLEPGTPGWDALRALATGESVTLERPSSPLMTVAASRVCSGLTAVLLDRDPLNDDPMPGFVGGGTGSASVAKQPTDADRAGMVDEAKDPAALRFLRRGHVIPDPDRFGLVVTDGASVPAELTGLPVLRLESRS